LPIDEPEVSLFAEINIADQADEEDRLPAITEANDKLETEMDTPKAPVRKTNGHLSNVYFAYDTTVIPYLESMFDDIQKICRRSSLVDKIQVQVARGKMERISLANRFLKRFSHAKSGSQGPYGADGSDSQSLSPTVGTCTLFKNR
jgi:hypothetical protein